MANAEAASKHRVRLLKLIFQRHQRRTSSRPALAYQHVAMHSDVRTAVRRLHAEIDRVQGLLGAASVFRYHVARAFHQWLLVTLRDRLMQLHSGRLGGVRRKRLLRATFGAWRSACTAQQHMQHRYAHLLKQQRISNRRRS